MKNKKIGMCINYDYPDYGGMLQAYASYRKVKELGFCPEAINVNCLSNDIKRRKLKYFFTNIFDFTIVKEKSQIVIKALLGKCNKELKSSFSSRRHAFDNFCKSHFVISKEYRSWNDLTLGCYNYNSVIVGSDQLWLPSNIVADYYTLSFVPNDVNKIAYATSFGVSDISKSLKPTVKKFLSRINYLSAREESGQKIIKSLTDRDVKLVCDPALLLTESEWNEEICLEPIIKERYIFCYFMGNNPWQRDFVKKLKERTGCKIVALLHLDQYIASDENYVDFAPYDISPTDFVNLVKYSEFVCTDSFHGTVFSIIFKKAFFTFMRFSDKATLSTNTRIATLLKRLKVEDRLIYKDYDIENLLSKKIDYRNVCSELESFRTDSLNFLINALGS